MTRTCMLVGALLACLCASASAGQSSRGLSQITLPPGLQDALNKLKGGDLSQLQDLINQVTAPLQNAAVQAPTTLRFDNSSQCANATSGIQDAFKSAVRVVVASRVNVDPSKVDVTQAVCDGNSAVLDLSFLGNLTDTTQLQDLVKQLLDNRTNIFPPDLLSKLNVSDVQTVVLSPIIDATKGLCSPLPNCLLNTDNLVNILEQWDNATSLNLTQFQGVVKQQVPFDLLLPAQCREVAQSQSMLQKFKQDTQSAVANAAGLPMDHVAVNKVSCTVNYTITRIDFLIDGNYTTQQMVDIVNKINDRLAIDLPTNFTDSIYNEATKQAYAVFNITQLPSIDIPDNPVAVVTDGIKQLLNPVNLTVNGNCSQVLSELDKYKAAMQVALALGLNQPADHVNVTEVTCDPAAAQDGIKTRFDVLFNQSADAASAQAVADKLSSTNSLQANLPLTALSASPFNIQGATLDQVASTIGQLLPSPSPTPGSPAPSPAPSPSAAVSSQASLVVATLAAVCSLLLAVA